MMPPPELGEVRFDVYRSGGQCSLRATHLPTGCVATVSGGTEHENRDAAFRALGVLLADRAAAPEGSVVLSPGSAYIDLDLSGKS